MKLQRASLLVGLFLAMVSCAQAKDIQFGGYTWTVKAGRGGPGPNTWDQNNVWLDSATNLHLKDQPAEWGLVLRRDHDEEAPWFWPLPVSNHRPA
jgi:hypothetical protein